MLQPVVRRTWAPRGCTPLLRQWDRHDRLSTISALTVAPRRRRFGLYWSVHRHNIRAAQVLGFLRALRRHLPRGFTLIWDRSRTHRAACVSAWLARHTPAVRLEPLPAYAPELNPVEAVWGHTKHGELANHAAADLDDVEARVLASLGRTRGRPGLLAAFCHHAGLDL